MNMNCKKVSEIIVEYLLGELTQHKADSVQNHLGVCARCSEEARALKNGFEVMLKLPICDISCNVEAVIEAASNQKKTWRLSNWLVFVPLAACVSLLIISGIFTINHFPSSRISHGTAPIDRHNLSDNAAIREPVERMPGQNTPAKNLNSQQIVNSAANSDSVRQLSVTASNRKTKHFKFNNQQPPSNVVRIPVISKVNLSNTVDEIDNNDKREIVSQYVDTIASCMISSVQPRANITCAITPITAADDDDQIVADTLTAVILKAFKDRHLHIETNRLLPSLSGVVSPPTSPDYVAAANIAEAENDQYLIIGSVAKSKAGYLLSLYTIDKNNTVVFNGDHPILLPADDVPQSGNT